MTKATQIVGIALWGVAVSLSTLSAQEVQHTRYVLNVSLDSEDRLISGTATSTGTTRKRRYQHCISC